MSSLVFYRGREIASDTQHFSHPPSAKPCNCWILWSQPKACKGPHRDQKYLQRCPLLKWVRISSLSRIMPRLPKLLLPQAAQPVPCPETGSSQAPNWSTALEAVPKPHPFPAALLSALRPRFMRVIHGCGYKKKTVQKLLLQCHKQH